MFLNALAMIVAIVLSIAAGIISVLGLAAIFSGAYLGVITVAGILEVSKVVVAAWLHRHWNEVSRKLRTYLVVAVVALMGITSLGIYGFFSKAHIEQQISMATGNSSRIPILVSEIAVEKEKAKSLDDQIKQINDALTAMTTKGTKSSDAKRAIDETNKQRKTLDGLRQQKNTILTRIGELEKDKLLLENEKKKQEVEVGPLKYIANMYYGVATEEQLEHSVRILILALVFVFDPLAIAMVIASGHKFQKTEAPTLPKTFMSKQPLPTEPVRVGRKSFTARPTKKQKREKFQAKQNRDKVLNLNRLKLG